MRDIKAPHNTTAVAGSSGIPGASARAFVVAVNGVASPPLTIPAPVRTDHHKTESVRRPEPG